jgi:hypothetical protein
VVTLLPSKQWSSVQNRHDAPVKKKEKEIIMKTLIAPNGMKIVYNDSDERKVQRIIKKAQEIFDAKTAKREEKQKEYFLRVRARYEVWEAKKTKAAATEAEETIDAVEPVEVEAEVVEDIEEAV